MLATVQLVQSEYERRLKSRDQREPWILVCDEFSSLMRGELAKPLALLLESIAQEGRKLGIYAMALGQNWKTTRAGGGELRDSFASAFVHRLRPEQAKMLTGLFADDLPRDILELPPGTSYLMSNAGELRKVRVPMCTAADLQSVARLLGNAPESPVAKPECGQLVAVERAAYCPPQPATAPTAEQQRVLSLFLSGMSPAQIVHELHGVKSSQGSKYQRALNGVLDVLRSSMGTQARAVGE
jgi:hypothetical protein